jgi:hypothetical protein
MTGMDWSCLPPPPTLQAGNSVSPFAFSTFATAVLTGLFIALLQFQAAEKAVVLNLLFQDFHGSLKVVVYDPDFQTTELPQIDLPFLLVPLFA